MAYATIDDSEVVVVDVAGSLVEAFFPFLELLLYTGIVGIAVGSINRPQGPPIGVPPMSGWIMVGVWFFLVLWRFVWPCITIRRRRLIVTDEKIIIKGDQTMKGAAIIPLTEVGGATRQGKDVYVTLMGSPQPVVLHRIARAKAVVRTINETLDCVRPQAPRLSYF